jgi:hypothetical protein
MKKVDFRLDQSIALHIHALRSHLVGTKKGPPTFSDKLSRPIQSATRWGVFHKPAGLWSYRLHA